MHYLREIGLSRYFLWGLLGSPFVFIVAAYAYGEMFYGEVLHSTGEISARLMMTAMAATPLLLMFGGRALPRWLMKNRRYFGVASFAYATLHTVVYLEKIHMPDAVESPAPVSTTTRFASRQRAANSSTVFILHASCISTRLRHLYSAPASQLNWAEDHSDSNFLLR